MRYSAGVDKLTDSSGVVDWDSLRSQFPVTKDFIYFNHAAIAPISMRVRDQVSSCMQRYCEYGIVCNREFLDMVEKARELAGRLINASSSEIAFVKNTTQGLLIAANGIEWQNGDNVLIPDKEFPANVFPWLNLSRRGVEVRFVPKVDGRFTVEDIKNLVDEKTRAISVSAVSFVDGFRCNLRDIGRFCHERGIFFIVDAIQALGAMEIDVQDCHVDLLSADAHKWLLGPQGIGIAYLSQNALDSFVVSNLGWNSMADESNHLRYDIRLKPGAARFEEGTLNIFGIIGLKATLEMLLSLGIPAIHKRILELNDLLVGGIVERGFEIRSSLKTEERSGILAFKPRKGSADDIYKKLFEAGVVCALRENAVRLSPHFYNNALDIEKFLEVLCL